MSDKTKSEELTKEQLEGVSGGFVPVDGVIQPIAKFTPVDGVIQPPTTGFDPVDA